MYNTGVRHHGNDDHGKAVVHGEDVDEPDECQKSECVANAKAWLEPTEGLAVGQTLVAIDCTDFFQQF